MTKDKGAPGFDPSQYEAEAKERWGETDAYNASAEAHRLQIENFYPCSYAMHVGLAQMYTADARFTEHYDKRVEGLAAFVQAAIEANAKRAGAVS